MKSVSVIMSTYNGEKYLKQQIDSILKQEGIKINLFIRDDGSTDKTVDIIKEYMKENKNILLFKENNVGATKSFFILCNYLNNNGTKADYYAFSDQDDVWDKNKLIRAINILNQDNKSTPNLYYSNLKLVDNNLKFKGYLFKRGIVKNTKGQSLAQIFTYGCTCVFNKEALNKICYLDINANIYHDNWIYLVCKFLGNVYYDDESYINYRQHENNLSGTKNRGLKLLSERFKRLLNYNSMGHPFENMSKQIIKLYYNELLKEDLRLLYTVANYRNSLFCKLKLLFSSRIIAGTVSKDFCIKIRVLINKV